MAAVHHSMQRQFFSTFLATLMLVFPASASRLEQAGLPAGGFAEVVSRVLPSVVRVATTRTATAQRRSVTGEGSGVIIASDGYVLTNHHVIEGADRIMIQLGDERELEAHVLAADPQTDIAVLKLDASGLPAASFGDSSGVRTGDYAIAIGNPFGVGTTVTLGIVSAVSRSGTDTGRQEEWIQTDAAINPGNSGGPLIATNGELIGLNTAIVSPSGASSGIGFAIPSNLVRAVMSELIVHGRVRRGYMGIGMQPLTPALAEALQVPGPAAAVIADVAPGSPGAQAGLRKGDAVAAIGGRQVRDFGRLRFYSALTKPGTIVRVQIYRDGVEMAFDVTLADPPAAVAPPAPSEIAGAAAAPGLPGAKASVLDAKLRSEFGLPESAEGIVLASVDPDSETIEAGLRPGDLIVAVNRRPVRTPAELDQALDASKGRAALVEVSRAGSTWLFGIGGR